MVSSGFPCFAQVSLGFVRFRRSGVHAPRKAAGAGSGSCCLVFLASGSHWVLAPFPASTALRGACTSFLQENEQNRGKPRQIKEPQLKPRKSQQKPRKITKSSGTHPRSNPNRARVRDSEVSFGTPGSWGAEKRPPNPTGDVMPPRCDRFEGPVHTK